MTSLNFTWFLHGVPFDGFPTPFHLSLKAAMDGFSPSVQTECTSSGGQDPTMLRRWESEGLPWDDRCTKVHQRSQHASLRPPIHRVFEISRKPGGKHRPVLLAKKAGCTLKDWIMLGYVFTIACLHLQGHLSCIHIYRAWSHKYVSIYDLIIYVRIIIIYTSLYFDVSRCVWQRERGFLFTYNITYTA